MSDGGREPEVLYREHVYYGPAMWVLILGLIILYIVVVVGAVAKRNYTIAVYMGIIAVVLLALLANFWRLTFTITSEEVVFGFGLIKKRFRLEEITACEPYSLEFGNYLGYGIRVGRDRTVAYNTRNGPGVKLDVEGRERAYVVSLKDPAGVCRILGRLKESK